MLFWATIFDLPGLRLQTQRLHRLHWYMNRWPLVSKAQPVKQIKFARCSKSVKIGDYW